MSTALPSRTKADRKAIAKRARQYGYYRGTSDREAKVQCPLCRTWVTGYQEIDYAKGRLQTVTVALDIAMLAHLNDEDGCPEVSNA